MTLIMQRATYVADNGTVFSFEYLERTRIVLVRIDDRLHMTIAGVAPNDSTKEMNSFMDSWNQANPGNLGIRSEVYVAFNSVPDFSAGHAPFTGIATTLDGAIKLLYPKGDVEFIQRDVSDDRWTGPDGFGEVRRVAIVD